MASKKKEVLFITILLTITISIFLTIAIILSKNHCELEIDNSIGDKVYAYRGGKWGFVYWIFRIITEMGYFPGIAIVFIILLFSSKLDRNSILFIFGLILACTFNCVVKIYFDRERPNELYQWMHDSESSFPSGHSCSAAFIFSYLTYYVFKSNRKNSIKYLCLGISIILVISVMVSRIVLGMHYFSDVIAGSMIGIIGFCLTAYIYMLFEKYEILDDNLIMFKRKKNEEESINS